MPRCVTMQALQSRARWSYCSVKKYAASDAVMRESLQADIVLPGKSMPNEPRAAKPEYPTAFTNFTEAFFEQFMYWPVEKVPFVIGMDMGEMSSNCGDGICALTEVCVSECVSVAVCMCDPIHNTHSKYEFISARTESGC
jgi:hypothetical protein